MMTRGIVCGDYLSVAIPAESIDLVITSPPYPGLRNCTMTHAQWLEWMARVMLKLHTELQQHGVLVLNVSAARVNGALSAEFWSGLVGLFRGWHWVDTLIWDKINPVPAGAQRNGRRYDLQSWEPVYILAKSTDYTYQGNYAPYAQKTRKKAQNGPLRAAGIAGHYHGGHSRLSPNGACQTNVLRLSPSGGRHRRPRALGQSFPVELPWRMITTYSYPNDLVLDPFAGVGTVCYAAKMLGRRWLGIELSPTECQKARAWLGSCSYPPDSAEPNAVTELD